MLRKITVVTCDQCGAEEPLGSIPLDLARVWAKEEGWLFSRKKIFCSEECLKWEENKSKKPVDA